MILAFLAVMIPVMVFFARQTQKLTREAAFAQAIVNFTPLSVTKAVGENFTVDIYFDSGTAKVSGAQLELNIDPNVLEITQIQTATSTIVVGQTPPADSDILYEPFVDQKSITFLFKKPTADLPSGSFKIGTVTFRVVGSGPFTIDYNAANSEAVGFNELNTDVSITLVAGTKTALTTTGSLCSLNQCLTQNQITLTEVLRSDKKWSVAVSWPENTTGGPYFYKVYRNLNGPVPTTHPEANFIGTTGSNLLYDTNGGAGFGGLTNLYYDIDTYQVCN
jgi:hypothetical protein